MSEYECERCGRRFEKEPYRDVHPCPEIVGEQTARAIRHRFAPGQLRLDEYEDGERPPTIDVAARR
jgi:hypothetical protein